ncbi:putative ABC transporter permease subunit [Botrimarina hoheduenensis]|uniref:Uncharacterized protein n=1 Tax=Botrimarina hoheduenensis TaxID=2528000 RepID=A0A5C5VQE5_9BACT|nr:hypothetical protein [Botrimarina hoheduenensis]TWT40263.1 hypothetical protein Pla111_33950 [Botrimarina hoheduenensis]
MLGAADEARLMRRLRYQTVRAQLKQVLTTARLRTGLVILLSVLFWIALFAMFYFGLEFLVKHVGPVGDQYHAQTIEFIFHLFFASLNVMLIFSAGIILYSGLFASEETRFLLTQPLRPERIVQHKLQEATLFSSWGFFLLASPLTIAYGLVAEAPWHYYALIGPLILAFVYIPSGIGAAACLLLIRYLSHLRLTVAALVASLAVGAAGWAIWETVRTPQAELFGAEWFNDTLRRFRFTQSEMLPSSWLSNALLDAASPPPTIPLPLDQTPAVRALMFLALLVSNALVCQLVVVTIAKRTFRRAFSELECRPRAPRRAGLTTIDRVAGWLFRPFPAPVQLILMKDWRLLRRDPVQWSQFLIFFGLLGLYFLNINRFSAPGSNLNHTAWINTVSFLNLGVVGLILSTFTTRFIYPMISLEGRRFWILGLLPVSRRTILWSKFLFAALGSLGPCGLLILTSDLVLGVDPLVVGVHQFTMMLLCVGLAGLAVGLGAAMPDFRESSPSKIAAGFGGTLNLVLSATYISLIVLLTALPCHLYLVAQGSGLNVRFLEGSRLIGWLIGGAVTALLLATVTTIVPLRRGIRAFNQLEFY